MSTIDDLRAAFSRLEARTPLTTDALPTGEALGATIIEFTPTPNAARPRRRAAFIGGGLAVAATVAGVVLATSLGGSSPAHTPAGGTVTPATSAGTSRTTTVAPAPTAATTGSSSISTCPTENAAGVCATPAGNAGSPSSPSSSDSRTTAVTSVGN